MSSNEQLVVASNFIVTRTPTRKQRETISDAGSTTVPDTFVFENLISPLESSQRSVASISVWSQDIGDHHSSTSDDDDLISYDDIISTTTDDDDESFEMPDQPSFDYQITGEAIVSDAETFADIDDDIVATRMTQVEEKATSSDDQQSQEAMATLASDDQFAAHASRRKSTRLWLVKAVESRNTRAEKVLEELTINKLKIASLGLVGRDQEKLTLKECYQRLCTSTINDPNDDSEESGDIVSNELVFIQGYSGIGKSALARTIQEDSSINSTVVYVEGKYEFTSTDEPYSGLSQAFGKLCNKFHECPFEIREKISRAIEENMREEAYMLMDMIPEISVFFQDFEYTADTSFLADSSGREHERWKYAFRTFTRILGSYFSPIVIMLDDLQWADISSLDIMDYLISDLQNPHPLMIIGCYRSNEVDENSTLYNRIQTLEGKHQNVFHLTDIKLENCNLESVNKIIMSMMSIDNESETRELAEVCFKRTLGNPFFLIEFMRMLQTEGLLEFNIGLMKWIWEVEKIENGTTSAANVVDLLQARMKKMSNDAQLLLQYAACLGASFSVKLLEHIWSQHAFAKLVHGATDDFDDMLEMIKEVGFVEPCGSDDLAWADDIKPCGLDELRWVHDKVQEAALSLSDLVTPEFQCDLGMFLYRGLARPRLEQKLFDVADLMNKGNHTDSFDVALTNFHAALKASKMAAISSAAKYARFGIKQLVSDKWTLHRMLTLQLYSLGAEMEYALGNIDKAEEYIEIVLARDEYTPLETFPLKKMKVNILAVAHLRWDEAIDYGLEALKELGFEIVWNRKLKAVQMLLAVRKIAKRLKKVDVEDVECLDFIEDETKMLAVVEILHVIKHVAYVANDLPLCFICSCKLVELTLDYGISRCSASCFSATGGVLMFLFKDHAAAMHVCDLAFELQKRSGRRFIADTVLMAWSYVLVHIKPLHEGLNLLMDGYSQGLRDADPLNATNCMAQRFVLLPYMMGRSLDSVIKEFPKIAPQMEESGIKNNILILRIWWQMMENLTLSPSDESSKKLEGEQFRQSEEKAESNIYVGNVNLAIGELLLFFGDYEGRAERLLGEEKEKTYSELVVGYPPHTIETFHRGIVWFEMARKTGQSEYMSRAIKIKKEIRKWVEKGNPNALDYDLLLSAEQCVLKKKYKKADEFYNRAIVHAARIGHLAHAALYNERFGKYLLDVHGYVEDCKYHMKEAIQYYREWGAIGKAEQLQKLYFG